MNYSYIISPLIISSCALFTLIGLQTVFADEFVDGLDIIESLDFSNEPPLFSEWPVVISPGIALIQNETNTSEIDARENFSSTDFNLRNTFYDLSIQKKSLSCESSATSDILETLLQQQISEDEVIEKLPIWNTFNQLPTWENWERIWWDPNKGFVGNIDSASQSDYTWYWVYESPIAQVYNSYWFETEIINRDTNNAFNSPEEHLQYLLENLEDGNMVQLWGDWCTDPQYEDGILNSMVWVDIYDLTDFTSAKNTCVSFGSDRTITWNYYDDEWNTIKHEGLNWEHAFILLGWKWDIDDPDYIRVWDTDTGYHMYDTAEWMRKWEAMDYRSIVIKNN